MRKTLSFILLGLILISSSCNKEEDPGCTGCLGSFQCKINGKTWKPNCDSGTILWGCSAIDCQYYVEDSYLALRIINEEQNDRLRFSAKDLKVMIPRGLVDLNREYIDYTKGNCGGYNLMKSLPNSITLVNLDTINQIVQGRFEFSVLGTCEQDTLHITDGIFHLGYRF